MYFRRKLKLFVLSFKKFLEFEMEISRISIEITKRCIKWEIISDYPLKILKND